MALDPRLLTTFVGAFAALAASICLVATRASRGPAWMRRLGQALAATGSLLLAATLLPGDLLLKAGLGAAVLTTVATGAGLRFPKPALQS
ncbi:MAG TPA: hypothetical protein VNZ52_07125, partial [Candidatus Thermoplasmatota archaeon]|nr:hypothetical protein [Candidatus Thermoplasmatota archaeon]